MYPQTYYAQTRSDLAARPALHGAMDTDTVIVGAGLAGLTTALELAREGVAVTVLETESIGFGASGRNGGIVSPAFACGSDAIEARVGPEKARALHRLTIEGVQRLRGHIQTLNIPQAEPVAGLLNLRRFDQAQDLRAYAQDFERDYGYAFTYLDRPTIQERLQTTRYLHGLEDPLAFHIHPLNYLRALAAEVERLGGKIYEHSPATGCALGPQKRLRTPNGQVTAKRAIFATGGYTGPLIPRIKRAVLPIATYMMVSKPAPDLLAKVIKTPSAVLDDRLLYANHEPQTLFLVCARVQLLSFNIENNSLCRFQYESPLFELNFRQTRRPSLSVGDGGLALDVQFPNARVRAVVGHRELVVVRLDERVEK